jgi:hypothetical protein
MIALRAMFMVQQVQIQIRVFCSIRVFYISARPERACQSVSVMAGG